MTLLLALYPLQAADSRASTFLDLAASRLTASVWGNRYAEAVAHLAAHMIIRAPANPVGSQLAGTVTSRNNPGGGTVSASMPSTRPVALADVDLMTTAAGVAFLNCRDTRAARAPFAIDVSS